ncbi:MAG TPA: bifunctional riboflavin kinase/FAD synthetase [Candidatus Limnocylindria bacterium]|nr:bifunctional riboflavin kinase/FAD synthetase [Candidatus Limnocylindria bacterium]
MTVVRDLAGWPPGPLHLAVGVFDGVHRGHQALIGGLARDAHAAGATAVAATFDPLPIDLLAPGAPPSALSDAAERAELLRRAGADAVVVFTFDAAFASLSSTEFADRLAAAGQVRRIVVGSDFRFGKGRQGDVAHLEELGRTRGFDVRVVHPIELDGAVVSSTRIRNALAAGHVEDAARLLGRPYAVPGRVEHGEKRGRGLGYPTLNIATPPRRLLPNDGIYAMWVSARGERLPAAASLGVRPTFGGGARVLEAYLLDWSGDLYGEHVEAAFVRRIRDEAYFEGPEALAAQIAKDVEATRAALSR